jgi:carbonic anhydrase/acetyltransferase-like protein (isoleucine patch superfamily)
VIVALGDRAPRIARSAFVHPRATVVGDVEIGEDSSIWPGAVLRGDFGWIRVGRRTSIQDNAVIHADADGTAIGDDCIIGHLAFVENAIVGDACMIAVGAKLHGARMQPGSVAAAGAVLVGGIEVPSGYRAQGVPAELVAVARPDRAYIERGAARYVEMARLHARFTTACDPGMEEDERQA